MALKPSWIPVLLGFEVDVHGCARHRCSRHRCSQWAKIRVRAERQAVILYDAAEKAKDNRNEGEFGGRIRATAKR
jgi:hypothetical protein